MSWLPPIRRLLGSKTIQVNNFDDLSAMDNGLGIYSHVFIELDGLLLVFIAITVLYIVFHLYPLNDVADNRLIPLVLLLEHAIQQDIFHLEPFGF